MLFYFLYIFKKKKINIIRVKQQRLVILCGEPGCPLSSRESLAWVWAALTPSVPVSPCSQESTDLLFQPPPSRYTRLKCQEGRKRQEAPSVAWKSLLTGSLRWFCLHLLPGTFWRFFLLTSVPASTERQKSHGSHFNSTSTLSGPPRATLQNTIRAGAPVVTTTFQDCSPCSSWCLQ